MASFSYKKRYNYWLSESEAKAAEEEERNNKVLRWNLNDVADAIKEATGVKEPPYRNPANAIPYSVAHAVPTPLEQPQADYDRIRARTAAEPDALLTIHSSYIGDTADKKESYALPHHRGSEPFKCNLKAVKSCLKALGVKVDPSGIIPTDHPLATKNAAVSHLLTHLKEFEAQTQAQSAQEGQNGA